MRTVQQIAPIYTEKFGADRGLGWVNAESPYDSAAVTPSRFGGFGVKLVGMGDLRNPGASPGTDELGPFAVTMASTFGAGIGGGIIGFVAGKADNDAMWRGAIFSASLAGMGNSMAHMRSDTSKVFGAFLLISSLWGMFWAVKPMVRGAQFR
jgi:hypothetical protein